jgi:uncharacterized protein (TIGR03435 family)
LQLLNDRWQALPADEAAALVRELVAVIVAAADQKGRISWNDVRFSSTRQHLLFCLFNSCRHLEPELAASLVAEYPQLAKAVTRYPNGMARDWEDADGRVPGAPPTHARTPDLAELAQMDYLTLDNASLPVAEELRSNFDRAFTVALSAYAIDSDQRRPNTAPRQCWPSAMSFRSILYKAGIYEGRRAERHLARVPDAALRLFAQIELAAALAGVDQFGGTAMRQAPEWPRPQPERDDTIDPADWMPPMPPPFAGKPDVSPSYEARISVSQQPDGGLPTGGCDEDFWVIEGARLRPVLASLFDMSALRIVVPPALEHERFDFTLVLPRPETREVLLASMQVGVERNFDITRERRPVEAWVLTAPRGIQAHRTYGDLGSELGAGGGIAGGSWEMVGPTVSFSHQASDFEDTFVSSLMDLSAVPAREEAFEQGMQAQKDRFLRMPHGPGAIVGLHQSLTMRELCLVLESTLGRVFVDESGTSASYWINVETDPMDPDRFLEMLNKELGVEIAPAEREVEMLVVRRA